MSRSQFDCHDSWRYGWSENPSYQVNITKASNDHTIEQWSERCPSGVNYQIILVAEEEPAFFVAQLEEILGSTVLPY